MTQYAEISTQTAAMSRSPLQHWHAAHGARFVERDGWNVPAAYTTIDEEISVVQNGVGLCDVSAAAKFALNGPGVGAMARSLSGDGSADKPRSVTRLASDRDSLVCRLTHDRMLMLASGPNRAALEQALTDCVANSPIVRQDVTSALAGFALVGTACESLLRRVTAFDVSASGLSPGSCVETALAGVHALLLRPPFEAIARVRAYVAWDTAEYVWNRLFDAGREMRIKPIGWDAIESLRRTN
jgi:heterotetrameric sarcosine oxidase gamma subunit